MIQHGLTFFASRLYPGDSNAVLAAQYHIMFDEICSRNPQFKKNLEMLAMLSGRKKKRKRKKNKIKNSVANNLTFLILHEDFHKLLFKKSGS